jgi:hypothetical protein
MEKNSKKQLRTEFDLIRATEKRVELLASSQGNWVEDWRDFSKTLSEDPLSKKTDWDIVVKNYRDTSIYKGKGSITVRVFYKEDKELLKNCKYISPKLKKYLAKL